MWREPVFDGSEKCHLKKDNEEATHVEVARCNLGYIVVINEVITMYCGYIISHETEG